jgi:hypothetical protein
MSYTKKQCCDPNPDPFLGLLDPNPDPLVEGMDPEPSITIDSPSKDSKKNRDSSCFVTSF